VRSFQVRGEAEAFAKQFAAERPFVIEANLPEKGLWYRVRIGEFRSYKEAVDAKVAFERRYNVIALVVGPF
jgi:hypothetical protein